MCACVPVRVTLRVRVCACACVQVLDHVAARLCARVKGGGLDHTVAARHIVSQYRSGAVGTHTLDPVPTSHSVWIPDDYGDQQ